MIIGKAPQQGISPLEQFSHDVWSHPMLPEVDFENRFRGGDVLQQHCGSCILTVLGHQIVILIEVEGGLLWIELDQPPLPALAGVLISILLCTGLCVDRYFPYWESSGSMGSPNEMMT